MNKTNNESKNVDYQDQDIDKHLSKLKKNKSNEEDIKKTKQEKKKNISDSSEKTRQVKNVNDDIPKLNEENHPHRHLHC